MSTKIIPDAAVQHCVVSQAGESRPVETASGVICMVTYQGAALAIRCLEAAVAELKDLPHWRIVVADSASPDGTGEVLERAIEERGWQSCVELIRLAENRGFAAGNNAAIRRDLESDNPSDYYMLLNPDAILRAGSLKILCEFLEEHPQAGIAGARNEDEDGTPQYCCFNFPSIVGEFAGYLRIGLVDRMLQRHIVRKPISDETEETGWVSGAAMLVRREVFEDVGLMDDSYFLYYEETDFILNAARAGWSCWHVPASRVIHLVGQSTGVTLQKERPKRWPDYWFESRRRYFVKNYGGWYAAAVDLVSIGALASWKIRKAIQRKDDNDPPKLLTDLARHSVFVRGCKLDKASS